MDAEQQKHQYTIFQVLELAHEQDIPVRPEPESCSDELCKPNESCTVETCDSASQDDLYQFVLCVKNLNKPTLRQIDQQRVDLTYWLSTHFGRYIPTKFLLPIIDIDMTASSLSACLPRDDVNAINVSRNDIYRFLKNISPLIDVPIESIDEWRKQHKRLRIYHQQYIMTQNYMDQEEYWRPDSGVLKFNGNEEQNRNL